MKLLFVIDKLNTGGVSSSLLNLLHYLDGKAECDLLVFSGKVPEGVSLPKSVRVLKAAKPLRLLGQSQREVKNPLARLARTFLVAFSKAFGGRAARKLLFAFVKPMKGYDGGISFTHDVTYKSLTTGCNQFVQEKVKAKKRVAFVHCDYEKYGGYHPKQVKNYRKFDYVACVSEGCRKSFVKCFPALEGNAVVVENLTNVEKINGLLGGYEPYEKSNVNFVTVCRLAEEKGLDRGADAFARLQAEGIPFRWTIVGDGPMRAELESKIRAKGLENRIVLVGEQTNPFYYMLDADFFLLPSYHEAAPMVFGECIAVGLPILSTETISARQLVEERGAGRVCENSTEGIYQAVKQASEEIITQGRAPRKRGDANAYARKSVDELLCKLDAE